MRVQIPYGFQSGGKIIKEGVFICPLCHYKRPYGQVKVTRNFYFGLITFPSGKNLGEYVQCGGCFRPFLMDVLDPATQLAINISDESLPPRNMFEFWQKIYQELECEAILANKTHIVGQITPILLTSADNMQKAGVSIRLEMIDDVKKYMSNIFSLTTQWLKTNAEFNNKFMQQNQKLHARQMQFMEAAHLVLSRLP